jgi:ArsR family transcriptional regulator
MSTTATDLATTAQRFQALSDETRLAVVQRLRDGDKCVCVLMDQVDAAQSRLSFHLKVLKDAGIIDSRREGRWAFYWLRPDAFEEMSEAVNALSPSRAGRLAAERCCG